MSRAAQSCHRARRRLRGNEYWRGKNRNSDTADTGFAVDRKPAGDFPIEAPADSYFAVGEHGMIQFRHSVFATKIIAHSKVRFFKICASVEGYVLAPLIFKPRCGKNGVRTHFG